MKRKAQDNGNPPSPKRSSISQTDDQSVKSCFRPDLFEPTTLQTFRDDYTTSMPYQHAVVSDLIEKSLLRAVRSEITNNIHFTLKETDIYRIHQSGDLANLSNLDVESLAKLPSLVKLRDALYSPQFREWISSVTGAGRLSGTKTDMAVNVYTPGSYLLCHDDVIGSRRVSYILYLTTPVEEGEEWREEWGGGLRLYPTETKKNKKGENIKVPIAEWSKTIPPAFSQLSFFAVQPGESYHDVEEVYHAKGLGSNTAADNKKRIRMAVSGWYHIPQPGEDGYEEGVEQAQAQKSSLAQLKGAADEFDEPTAIFRHFDEGRRVVNSHATGTEIDPSDRDDQDDSILTEQDLTFLLKYIAPGFLVPDKLEELSESFEATSMLQLDKFLTEKFAKDLKSYIETAENEESSNTEQEEDYPSKWNIARPPHKHRFAYLQEELGLRHDASSPISRLLIDLLHSHAFKKWLAIATGLKTTGLLCQHALARRFRRGKDYALAHTFTGDQPRLEFTINFTPSIGWDHTGVEDEEQLNGNANKGKGKNKAGTQTTNGHGSNKAEVSVDTTGPVEFGGEEVYMAGEDDEEESAAAATTTSSSSAQNKNVLPSVGSKSRPINDPAVYRTQEGDDDDDDGILFNDTPSWNQFSVVLRDKGTMRFVKYVSQAAKGDRWDIKGEVELSEEAFEGDDNEDEDEQEEVDDMEDEYEGEDNEESDDDHEI